MFGKYDGWDKVFSDDPLGFKRDAAIKAREDKSLSSMDLFSGLNARQQVELDGLVKGDGSIDKVGLAFSSFIMANEHESQFSSSMKNLAASSMLSSVEVEGRYSDNQFNDLTGEAGLDSVFYDEDIELYHTECKLENGEPLIPDVTLSLSEQISILKALDRHNILVFCSDLVSEKYTEHTTTSAEFLARFKREKYSRSE